MELKMKHGVKLRQEADGCWGPSTLHTNSSALEFVPKCKKKAQQDFHINGFN